MDFGEFIDAFGTGYAMIFDYETNMKLNKPYFCRHLLCSITNDETVVMYMDGIADSKHRRSESAFNAFYRNNARRSLHPIAERIIDNNNIDASRFIVFLEEYCENYSEEKLLTNFKKYLPSTSSSTLFEDITNEFIRILKEEAAKPDKRRKEPVSLNNTDSANESDVSLEAKMDTLLTALIETGREIAELKQTGVSDDVRRSRLIETLNNYFEQLFALSNQLPRNANDEKPSVYCAIRTSVQSLTAENFILSKPDFMIESLNNHHIHRLIELLSKLQDKH